MRNLLGGWKTSLLSTKNDINFSVENYGVFLTFPNVKLSHTLKIMGELGDVGDIILLIVSVFLLQYPLDECVHMNLLF